MGFCVVHMQKMKMSACGGVQSHLNREHESKTNKDIDYSQTKNNYGFCETDNLREDIKCLIEDIVQPKKAIRKDAVVCCNFVITSDYETLSQWSLEKQKKFFEDSYYFFAGRYGIENVVYANVHMDEKTPHMHLGVVPITKDKRLSAKTLFTPLELKHLQSEFAEQVGKEYGLERGADGSTNKHIEMKRFKKETLEKELQILEERISEDVCILDELEVKKDELSIAEARLKAVESDLKEKQEFINDLDLVINEKAQKASEGFEMGSLRERIAEAKQKDNDRKLLALFKKFIELPAVRPLWEKFLDMQRMQKKKKTRDYER